MASAQGEARREPVLGGRQAAGEGVLIRVAPPAARLSLRAGPDSISAFSAALKVDLPVKPRGSAARSGRHALNLGPDEWLVIDEQGRSPAEDCREVETLHSAVDISHRNMAFLIEGPRAEDVLSAGCPLDLAREAFPVGTATRTTFGKVEIVLYRTGYQTFRMECWRSFADYAFTFLEQALLDPA